MIRFRSIHLITTLLAAATACDFGEPPAPDAATDCPTWFEDADRDGHGGPVSRVACTQPEGFVASHDDCDDRAPDKHPGLREVCDELDNDCEPNTAETCAPDCTVVVRPGGSRYLFCGLARTAAEAATLCAQNDFELARIDDDDENNFVNVRAGVFTDTGVVYLGGTSRAGHVWTWPGGDVFWTGGPAAADGKSVDGRFEAWGLPEPDRATGEGCLVLSELGTWEDGDCADARPFVCERARAR